MLFYGFDRSLPQDASSPNCFNIHFSVKEKQLNHHTPETRRSSAHGILEVKLFGENFQMNDINDIRRALE